MSAKTVTVAAQSDCLPHHIHQLLHQPQVLHMFSSDRTCNLIPSSALLSHNISPRDTWCVTEERRGESEAWLMSEPVSQRQPCWPPFTCLSHQRPNRATFQSPICLGHLSAKSLYLFLSLYLQRRDILLPVFRGGGGKEIFWFCGWKCAPRCLFVISPPLWLRALPRLRAAHPSFLAIAPSSSCTCPQRPIWKQTPPIFNSSLFIFICHHVRAELHSVASPLPATFADFPHTQACKRTHKPNTQTHTNFQQVSST